MESNYFSEIHREETVRKLIPQVLFGGEGQLVDVFKVSNVPRFYPSFRKDLAVVRRFTRLPHCALQAPQLKGGKGFSGHSLQIFRPVHSHYILKREHQTGTLLGYVNKA
jgi:hypothetical protein